MNTAYEPESFFTASQRKTTRPLYFGSFFSKSELFKWHKSMSVATWTLFRSACPCSLTSSQLFTMDSCHAGKRFHLPRPLSTAAFASGLFTASLMDGIGVLRKTVKSNGIVPSVSTAVIMTLQYHFLDYSIFVPRDLQVCARFFTHCFVDQFQWTRPRVCWRKRPTRADQPLINKKLGSERPDLPCNYSEASLWLSRATS